MLSKSFVILSLLCLGLAAPGLVHHEKRASIPRGFTTIGPAPADAKLNLRISLVSRNMADLEAETLAVSTPGNAKYGQHLSKEQVEAFVAPSQETLDKVNTWLKANGLTAASASPAGDLISVSLPVSKANDLLNADFTSFSHAALSEPSIRTMSYAIPSELKEHISFIHPTVNFPVPVAKAAARRPLISTPAIREEPSELSKRAAPASCSTSMTPACLQALYNIPTTKATQLNNVIGVTGLTSQYANYADLKLFLSTYRPDLSTASSNFTYQELDEGTNPQYAGSAGTEANLDTQYTIGVASNVPTSFIQVGEDFTDTLDGFLDQIIYLLNQTSPPHVLTTSYTINEDDVGVSLANSLCNAYMQLGARGTSILFSSGDAGVSGSWDLDCSGQFLPSFPNGCPYMTSVGSTVGVNPETAAYWTAGGFSNTWSVPSWQANTTAAYLKTLGSTYSGMYNAKGRGFPDVSTAGEYLPVVVNGKVSPVSGTSASSPVFAAVIGLINDRLIAAKKSPLGFLNPFLYSAAGSAAFNDITSGSNPGCNTNGFNATKGWDPVSGLGTPDFAKLLTAVGL